MMLEIFTIFLPCWQVVRHQNLRQETLETLAEWEAKNKQAGMRPAPSIASLHSKGTHAASASWRSLPSMERAVSVDGTSSKSVLMMEALEFALEQNPEPLQKFSALQDFSGENIAFLRAVSAWKAQLPSAMCRKGALRNGNCGVDVNTVREAFEIALGIYTEYVSNLDAAFPLNLASDELRQLESIFEKTARSLYGDKTLVDPGTPFETVIATTTVPGTPGSRASEKPIFASLSSEERDTTSGEMIVRFTGQIPAGFDGAVFDEAEASIKYLVLTNTWPKYVKEKRSSESLNGSNRPSEGGSFTGTIGDRCRAVGRAMFGRPRST
jgi:hypothetical protein